MIAEPYDLTKLDPSSFEHMVNALAIRVLGAGHTGFGPGADGGRDGYFEGEAPYPSPTEHWSGVWYVQSKFHKPHLSKNPQKWLLAEIRDEIKAFQSSTGRRNWPNNWILATNIEPSGAPDTGAFDQARKMVTGANPSLARRFHIWGGQKILDLLQMHPDVSDTYSLYLGNGKILASLHHLIGDAQANIPEILRYLIARQFAEQQFTKLEQAGSTTDNRPGIQRLFTDLPFIVPQAQFDGMAAEILTKATAENHQVRKAIPDTREWRTWLRHPTRARVWFIRGGPGQGKSTLTQYLSQINRAALILDSDGPTVTPALVGVAQEVKEKASQAGLWPTAPRIPVSIELKEFAQWFGRRSEDVPQGVLAFLADRIGVGISNTVHIGTLRRAFTSSRWLFIFDGLDEVPSDVRDGVAKEVNIFIDDVIIGCNSDAFSVCTSRPQGYSGEFDNLDGAAAHLSLLSAPQALNCAKPVLSIDRSDEEANSYFKILQEAVNSPSIREIMTTPLQAHIMAVVVRDGGRPPERRWSLYTTFYQIIKKREANKQTADTHLSLLLREGDKLLKNLHNRLGFELHSRAESSSGAQTALTRTELEDLIRQIVVELQDDDINETIKTLMEATTDRLVLVSTPESGDAVRFDIRPLQEFFAGEYVYESVEGDTLAERLRVISGDSHWREVMHFLLSALVENNRRSELAIATQALTNLNDGNDDGAIRALSRRLALGGILAARLLAEGVLDQDKRVRQQFERCIEPLCGCTDAPQYLSVIRRPHSRAWAINILVTTLREQSASENIGASAMLIRVMPDSHEQVSWVVDYILKTPHEYQATFFQTAAWGAASEQGPHAAWVLRLALVALSSAAWLKLGPEGISAATEILTRSEHSLIHTVAQTVFGNEDVAEIAAALFIGDSKTSRGKPEERITQQTKYGIVSITYSTTTNELDWTKWEESTWAALDEKNGILKLLFLACALSKWRQETKLKELTAALGGITEFLNILPIALQSVLPLHLLFSGIRNIEVNDQRHDVFSPSGCIRHISISAHNSATKIDAQGLLKFMPEIFVNFLLQKTTDAPTRQAIEFLNSDDGEAEFLKTCDDNPKILFWSPSKWSHLFSLSDSAASKIRAWLGEKALSEVVPGCHYDDSPEAFALMLPEEAGLLPHVVNMLTQHALWHRELGRRFGISGRPAMADIPKLASLFAPQPDILRAVALDASFPTEVRGAADVLYILTHDGTFKEDAVRNLSELHGVVMDRWYLRSVFYVLSDLIRQEHPGALQAAGRLLDMTREEFLARLSLDPLMLAWRETSRAPVRTKTKDVSIWA